MNREDLIQPLTDEWICRHQHAGMIKPDELRSLNAIHLATAALFETTLSDLITYEARMATVS